MSFRVKQRVSRVFTCYFASTDLPVGHLLEVFHVEPLTWQVLKVIGGLSTGDLTN